ncbi:MAG: hypothetical protein Q8L88_06745 [Bacteroidota bacterium]|nr:hypothetical protein [Bacteroidota bacterium]
MRTRISIALIILSILSLLMIDCNKDPVSTIDDTKPGRRDYIWSIDSVEYGNLPSKIQLESIWGSSSADIWGATGDAADVRDCLWHFDGTKWTRATAGTPITENTGNKVVYAVWGTEKNNVWAFGRKIKQNVLSAFIMHYDGNVWLDVTPSNVQAIAGHLYNVYGITKNNIWVGGYEYALHYDGSQWKNFKIADSITVGSIAVNDKYIYLNAYSPWGKNIQLAYMFDGSNFKLIDKTTDAELKFAGLFWATNYSLNSFANGLISATITLNGNIDPMSWHKEFNTPTFFAEKMIQSSKNIFAVGQWNLVYHYNGTDWKQIFIDIPNHTVDSFALFWGVWTDGNEVFICDTENGVIYHGR